MSTKAATAGSTAEIDSLTDAARIALATADGEVRRATDLLYERAMTDQAFLDHHFREAIRTACYAAVSGCVRQERRAVFAMPQPTSPERRAQINALASGSIRSLMDFPLPGGKRLGDATRGEVSEAADAYGKQARDMAWKSRWLGHIAQSLPDGKRVADVLTDERLEELRAEVGK